MEARQIVESDLGAPVDAIFSEFSVQPIGAASLAQVYRARLASTGEEVAVKVQRPAALSTISKDLYVLRRGVGVYDAIVKRFTAQTTDYQQLLSTFAEGLYTEMDFRNEALNQRRMRELLDEFEYTDAEVVIPEPNMDLTTRRVLVMEWISGEKLTLLPKDEINTLVKTGQEIFLIQLLEIGVILGSGVAYSHTDMLHALPGAHVCLFGCCPIGTRISIKLLSRDLQLSVDFCSCSMLISA